MALSVNYFPLQMKINKAREFLLQGDMSVKAFSFTLAFNSSYYFSRLFKKKTGISPSQWHGARIQDDPKLWIDNKRMEL